MYFSLSNLIWTMFLLLQTIIKVLSILINMYLPKSFDVNRIWNKVDFWSKFEFKVFLVLCWLPNPLLAESGGILADPNGTCVKWNANSPIEGLNSGHRFLFPTLREPTQILICIFSFLKLLLLQLFFLVVISTIARKSEYWRQK